MPLFDIPGWSVSAPPVTESSTHVSKKRKRPSSDSLKLQSAEVNLEKLVKRLKDKSSVEVEGGQSSKKRGKTSDAGPSKKTERKRDKKIKAKSGDVGEKKLIPRPKPTKGSEKSSVASPGPTKKVNVRLLSTEPSAAPTTTSATKKGGHSHVPTLTPLQQGMKQSLDGARFRLINENLYKTDSREAHQLMRDDPRIYEQYHNGFRHQVQGWPTNPVQHYISILSEYPPKTVIADLGCGDAALARALVPKGIAVVSFDLVSDGVFVVEADTCSKIPLPGSEGDEEEKSIGEGHVVDVVVCALSLMGTNWPNCLREAWRILKPDGELKIAEVASRFTDLEEFQTLVGSIGFKFKSKDDTNTHFTLFDFRKIPRKGKNEKEWAKVLSKGAVLKACEYKRR